MFPEWPSSAVHTEDIYRLSVTYACSYSYHLDFHIAQALYVISKPLFPIYLSAAVPFYGVLQEPSDSSDSEWRVMSFAYMVVFIISWF
jgi:hypothetical protein